MSNLLKRIRARRARQITAAKKLIGQTVTMYHGERVQLVAQKSGQLFIIQGTDTRLRTVNVSCFAEVRDA